MKRLKFWTLVIIEAVGFGVCLAIFLAVVYTIGFMIY